MQTGHGSLDFTCDTCGRGFSKQGLERHLTPPTDCQKTPTTPSAVKTPTKQSAMAIPCDRCSKMFDNQREYNAHRRFPDGECADHKKRTPTKTAMKRNQPAQSSYVDLDQPQGAANAVLGYHDRPDSPDNMSSDDEWCPDCETVFKSKAKFNAHALRCSSQAASVAPKPSEVSQATLSSVQQRQSVDDDFAISSEPRPVTRTQQWSEPLPATLSSVQSPPETTPSSPKATVASFVCAVQGCGRSYRFEAGLKVHQADVHGIGGKALDLLGSHSFMLNKRDRDQLKLQDLPRPPGGSQQGHSRGGRAARMPPPARTLAPAPPRATPPAISRQTLISNAPHASRRAPTHVGPNLVSVQVGQNMGGDAEIEQAKHIQGKMLRLLIQSDILIHNHGKISVCGIDWTRIGVARQHDAVELFEGMCHLPKNFQGEYLPAPTTFKDEYKVQYPVNDFKPSPQRDSNKPGLGIVALACSKILLADGRQEVVKIAAVDLVTCRILMNHLVCNDPHEQVANWRSSVTGLSGWHDMEGARQGGYKVFRGWSAVRSALWKFVDKETVVVGHNLRSDLDALRMIHGRAVDVAKVTEKAAKGPLSKAQLSLDSLCRDYLSEKLTMHPKYGRDCLMNAFAARGLGLWVLKNREVFEKDVRRKSVDYQKIMPKATAA